MKRKIIWAIRFFIKILYYLLALHNFLIHEAIRFYGFLISFFLPKADILIVLLIVIAINIIIVIMHYAEYENKANIQASRLFYFYLCTILNIMSILYLFIIFIILFILTFGEEPELKF